MLFKYFHWSIAKTGLRPPRPSRGERDVRCVIQWNVVFMVKQTSCCESSNRLIRLYRFNPHFFCLVFCFERFNQDKCVFF